jgi:hypothetical protein
MWLFTRKKEVLLQNKKPKPNNRVSVSNCRQTLKYFAFKKYFLSAGSNEPPPTLSLKDIEKMIIRFPKRALHFIEMKGFSSKE